jgi:aspartyl-tRNA(Asn)/glutamyl-tRNA(Gln) amidotransferase subunit B
MQSNYYLWLNGSNKKRLLRSFASWAVDLETGAVSCDLKPVFQTVIGLEVHAQLEVPTKLFSNAKGSITLSSVPNTAVHPFDVAVPGSLPRLSKEAVQQAVRTAAALQCDIPPVSRFERKHYAYADLPHGYQVTQQRWPLAQNGTLCCRSRRRKKRQNQSAMLSKEFYVDINRIQLEQDTGKTTNFKNDQESWVDFNRAGCALVEIVMAPQLKSPRQAGVALDTLRSLLIHIGTCNGRMEEGSLRCDLNISLSPISSSLSNNIISSNGGESARVEVKNLNSIRHVVKAAEYEAKRQAQELHEGTGEEKRSETRTFDASTSRTILLRRKEGEDDYRFLPEPDLPPVVLNEEVSLVLAIACRAVKA